MRCCRACCCIQKRFRGVWRAGGNFDGRDSHKLSPGPVGQRPSVPRSALRPVEPETLDPPFDHPFDPLASLLAETATGHERAFARLYELVGGRLFAVARRIVGRADLAEDVLQESFLRIWRSAHQYDPARGPAYGKCLKLLVSGREH